MLAIVQSMESRQRGISIFLLARPNSAFLTTSAVLEVTASWHGRGDVMAPRAAGLRKAIQRPDVSYKSAAKAAARTVKSTLQVRFPLSRSLEKDTFER